MHPSLMQDSTTSAALQSAQLENMPDPVAQAAGVSVETQNMAAAKLKLETTVKDLTISVDNHTQLWKAAQTELSEIDQKVGALQSRISMAKVIWVENLYSTILNRLRELHLYSNEK